MTYMYTHDKVVQCLSSFKRVAVWGAGELGKKLTLELNDHNIAIAFYIDKNPYLEAPDNMIPLFRFEHVPSEYWEPLDAIFLAFYTYRDDAVRLFTSHNINKPIIYYPNTYDFNIERFFEYNSYDDGSFLEYIASYIDSQPKPFAIYGAGRLFRYLYPNMPALSSASCVIDDDPKKQGKSIHATQVRSLADLPDSVRTVFIASTNERSIQQMERKLSNTNINIISLESIAKCKPEIIPQKAVYEFKHSAIPAARPAVSFEPDMDVILIEPPGRLLPQMIPNGIGYVHNIVSHSGARLQTVDLNILFRQWFQWQQLHQHDHGSSTSCFVMKEEPWMRENYLQWTTTEFVDFFSPLLRECMDGLVESRPKVVGISVNMVNHLFSSELIKAIRIRLPDTVILVGGPDCHSHEIATRKIEDFDYMVIGHPYSTLEPFIIDILAGKRPKDVPGIISRFDSPGRIFSPAAHSTDMDAYGYPRYQWSDIQKDYGDVCLPIITSHGCKWGKCRFCTESPRWLSRSPQKVVDEMEWWISQGYSTFSLNDSDTNAAPQNFIDLCREIKRRNLKMTIGGVQLRIDRRNTLQFFELLKEAGIMSLVFGVDGWTDRLLRLQKKGYNMHIVEQNLRDCHLAGIKSTQNMVIGVPGETMDDIQELVKNVIRLKQFVLLGQVSTLHLLVGNEYYNNPELYNINFHGNRTDIYASYLDTIPHELWFSDNPYIDQTIRVQRLEFIYKKLTENGVRFDEFCQNLIAQIIVY